MCGWRYAHFSLLFDNELIKADCVNAVIPAQAGIHRDSDMWLYLAWIPAYAGMT